MTLEDLHAEAARRLAGISQRFTTGRRALFDALAVAGRPMTVAEIVDARTGLHQSSIYRNLGVLEAAGVVVRQPSPAAEVSFELAEPFMAHHHHVICRGCGRMEDLLLGNDVEESLRRAAVDLEDRLRFRVDEHRLELLGRCHRCA